MKRNYIVTTYYKGQIEDESLIKNVTLNKVKRIVEEVLLAGADKDTRIYIRAEKNPRGSIVMGLRG